MENQEQEPLLLTAWRRCNEFAVEHNISYVILPTLYFTNEPIDLDL
jgi:hypothetical protein